MTLFIFKYCLPVLLGYTLFVGIAGRLNPLRKPLYQEERPSWFLGIWTAISATLLLSVSLQMAYGMTLEGARALAMPSIWFMAALLLPGFIAYAFYKRWIGQQMSQPARPDFDWSIEADKLEFKPELDVTLMESNPKPHFEVDPDLQFLDDIELPETKGVVIAAFLDSAELGTVNTENFPDPVNDHSESNRVARAEQSSPLSAEVARHEADETQTTDFDSTQFISIDDIKSAQLLVDAEADFDHTLIESSVAVGEQKLAERRIERAAPTHSDHRPVAANPTSNPEPATDALVQQRPDNTAHNVSAETQTLKQALKDENTLRKETERHLRITRKALAKLESQTRDNESRKSDSIIELEDQLAASITQQSELERMAIIEKSRRIALETNVVSLKQSLVRVKHDVRRGIAARAKALSTANKSIAFARQAIQTRARLESELAQAQYTIDDRQATVSSLIRALEDEKRKTDDYIASKAKQYVLREKQLRARRNLERVARRVEDKLATRIVKKVAHTDSTDSATPALKG